MVTDRGTPRVRRQDLTGTIIKTTCAWLPKSRDKTCIYCKDYNTSPPEQVRLLGPCGNPLRYKRRSMPSGGGGTSERTGAWVSQPQTLVFSTQSIKHRSRVLRISAARIYINPFCLIIFGGSNPLKTTQFRSPNPQISPAAPGRTHKGGPHGSLVEEFILRQGG